MNKKPLYILTYDHGGCVLWGERLRERFSSAIDWLKKYPSYKTGLDFEAFTFDELDKIDPEFGNLVKKTLKEYPDRFGLGSTTYGQPLSLYISEESNVRQLTYAIKTNLKHFGTTPKVYAISEFALNNQHPQLLKLCGYDACLMRTHVTNYGYQKAFDTAWALWVGRDGSEIPSAPTTTEQGEGYFNTTIDNWVLTRWPRDAKESLEDFMATCEKYEPLLASRYDDLTLREEALVADAQERDNYHFVLLDEIPEIFGKATEKIETTDNDFHGRMPWGYCGNEIFNGCRKGENNAARAEKLNAISVLLGGESKQELLEEAWKNILVAQHHDVTICGLLDDARRFIPASLAASAAADKASLADLAKVFASPENDGIFVFNPMSFPVAEWIETEAKGNCSASINGAPLATETVNGKLRIRTEIPALSAVRIDLSAEKSPAAASEFAYENGILETPLYRLTLNEKGIVSIFDKTSNRLLASNGEGKLFKACINDADCTSLGAWKVSVSDCSALAVSEGEIGTVPYRFEMKFAAGRAAIECKASFDIDDQLIGKIGLTRGLRDSLTVNNFVHETKLCFDIDLCLSKDRKMFRDTPFSIYEWDGQIQKVIPSHYKETELLADVKVSPEEGWNNVTYLDGIYWFALRDENAGLAVINRGCMGSAILGNNVSVPLIYSNDYIWNPRYLKGTFENEFALLPLTSESNADVHRTALCFQQPLVVSEISAGEGSLGSFSAADIRFDGGETILTALYPEDGAVFARFCNFSDEASTLSFTPAVGRVTAETDLLGSTLASSNGKNVSFRPWEIKTLKIEF
ncbi:MAG: hypothetical protein IIX84_00385 [Oscillospiraceae bacterium]|nr:hypothetical protein [Oscillospiraceae bacterium]